MDSGPAATQQFNGGIIFVSYLISVIGAMTTLEILIRRTHIRGAYNWFLLFCAAVSMGGVGIWSMHFIGNNSLKIVLQDGEMHQLSYSTGFTFLSLVISILTMFLAFTFVGITEKAKVKRILPSGIIAGGGIVSMHYIGQLAIEFFIMSNKPAFACGASIIAICAVTAALFIFFKLREQWENQWYKRLGCAMLMGVAVCGMHYTAMAGTEYYEGKTENAPPRPIFQAPALIGIICGIVVAACILLFFIGAQASMKGGVVLEKKDMNLILGVIIFDPKGRVLVKTDGVVPMKKVLDKIPENETFSSNHWLFLQFFETTAKWIAKTDEANICCDLNPEKKAFVTAANELLKELRFSELGDLGHLFDSVLTLHTIQSKNPASTIKLSLPRKELNRANSVKSLLSIRENSAASIYKETIQNDSSSSKKRISQSFSKMIETRINMDQFSAQDSGTEDKCIFLIRKLDNTRDMVDLLSLGFRFAEPVFISKTVSEKLQVPYEYLLGYFQDMLHSAESVLTFYTSTNYREQQTSTSDSRNLGHVGKGVFVGLFALVGNNENTTKVPSIIVDKKQPNTFPITRLIYQSKNKNMPLSLTSEEKNFILSISGKTLKEIAELDNNNKEEAHGLIDSPGKTLKGESSEKKNDIVYSQLQKDGGDNHPFNLPNEKEVGIQELKRALGKAANVLIKKVSPNRMIAKYARLHCDVIETPAFSLATSPSQLILFKTYIMEPSINTLLTDDIKCISFPLYKKMVHHITNIGIERFKKDRMKSNSSPTYLLQKHVYLSSVTNLNREAELYQNGINNNASSSNHATFYTPSGNIQTESNITPIASLLPPPRAKKTKEYKPRIYADTTEPMELFDTFNVLSAKERFWWLDHLYEGTKD